MAGLKIDVVESEEEGKRDGEFSGLEAIFHTEACALDKDDLGVVEKAVEQCKVSGRFHESADSESEQ